jgi:hypothetical protein
MAEWLRPVFARARTPVPSTANLSTSDRSISLNPEDTSESEDSNMSKGRPTSLVSYMPFRTSIPPVSTPGTFPTFRNPESIYHKPSGDQMAETLMVVMMNQSAIDPVPIEYNPCILHVLEAYQDLRRQLNTTQETIQELKLSHTKDIKEFEALATQWENKERDYKTEIKRLEVILSKTEGVMEAVSVARSNSVIHGTKRASGTIRRGIGTIKERNAPRDSREPGRYPFLAFFIVLNLFRHSRK